MSWFNKNEYKTFLKQRLKEEKKRFKVALDIEKYRIKKSNCLEYILDQIDLKIDRYTKELPKTGYFIIEDYSLPEYIKRTKFLFFTLRNERKYDKEIFEEVLNEVISFLIKKGSNDDYEWKHIVFGPNDLIENGTDRLVYKIEKENILLECTQAISIDYNIADIFNMNNNYRNAF